VFLLYLVSAASFESDTNPGLAYRAPENGRTPSR